MFCKKCGKEITDGMKKLIFVLVLLGVSGALMAELNLETVAKDTGGKKWK